MPWLFHGENLTFLFQYLLCLFLYCIRDVSSLFYFVPQNLFYGFSLSQYPEINNLRTVRIFTLTFIALYFTGKKKLIQYAALPNKSTYLYQGCVGRGDGWNTTLWSRKTSHLNLSFKVYPNLNSLHTLREQVIRCVLSLPLLHTM